MRFKGSAGASRVKRVAAGLAVMAGAATLAAGGSAAAAGSPQLAGLQAAWRQSIAEVPTPREGGCFTAHYPSLAWSKAACATAPNVPFIPKTGHRGGAFTVGNGDDFAIATTSLISTGVGSFPKVKGLTVGDRGRPGERLYAAAQFRILQWPGLRRRRQSQRLPQLAAIRLL